MRDVGPEPPEVGVHENVTETPALPETRPSEAILNVTSATEPPILPDVNQAETAGSVLVCTVTEVFPPVGAPIVRPESVTVTAVLAASAVPPVVMMMDVAPGAPGDRVAPLVDSVALGVAVLAKKPEG